MRHLFLTSLILINLSGCLGKSQGKSAQDNSVQQNVEQEHILSAEIHVRDTIVDLGNAVNIDKKENILFSEEEDISDTIGKYQISFRIVNNGKIFYSNGSAYADKNIILSVKRGEVYILHETTFDKTDFTSIINPHVMDEILLWKGKISEVQPGYVVTAVSATVPETDMLYDIRLTVHDDGRVVISGKEIVMEQEQ